MNAHLNVRALLLAATVSLIAAAPAVAASISIHRVRHKAAAVVHGTATELRNEGATVSTATYGNCIRTSAHRAECDAYFVYRFGSDTSHCTTVLKFRQEYGSSRVVSVQNPHSTHCS